MKPKMFLGSSTEGLEVARAIEVQLERVVEITVWSDGIFGLGRGTLESLVLSLEQFDFAILVLTPDDMVISREITSSSPRDNVLLELGLFIGHLGRERTFIVYNRDKSIKLPSDLAGVTMADFGDRQDGNLIAALGPTCTRIRYAINSLGTFTATRGNLGGSTSSPGYIRPFVTARVSTFDGGNMGTALNIIVHNSGNTPAKNVRLSADPKELESALIAKADDPLRKQVEVCFSDRTVIPVLENGKAVTNSFGWLSSDSQSTWKAQARFDVEVTYQDLDGREYKHKFPLLIADDAGFAGSFWEKPDEKK